MAKRANEDAQGGETAAPALRLSPNYQSSTADIELRSKDGVRFLVHKVNLTTASKVFADMFEVGSAQGDERPCLDLDETADLLERLLGYVYPVANEPWVFYLRRDAPFLNVIDKYEVPRAIEAAHAAVAAPLLQKTHFFDPPSFGNTLDAYLFGVKFGIESIAARSFPLLLAQTWPGNRAVLIEISGPQGFNVPLIERMQLEIFLSLMYQSAATAFVAATETLACTLGTYTQTSCETETAPPEKDPDHPEFTAYTCHAISKEALALWLRIPRLPMADWLTNHTPHLSPDPSDPTPCALCQCALDEVFIIVRRQLRQLERVQGLSLAGGQENLFLEQYRSWVKRNYSE